MHKCVALVNGTTLLMLNQFLVFEMSKMMCLDNCPISPKWHLPIIQSNNRLLPDTGAIFKCLETTNGCHTILRMHSL